LANPIKLVLLPGMEGTGSLFAPFLKELPDWMQPVIVSYPTDQALDYRGHLDIVMAALPVEQPFVLLGESFSGPLALMAAARHPKGLRGVILCATFVNWPLPLATSIAGLIVSMGLFRLKSTPLFLRILLGRNATDELRALFSGALAGLKPEVLAARARAVMNVDCTAELRECRVPILAMVADNDRIVAGRCPELIHRIRPEAEIKHFRSPHLILQCATPEAVSCICRFAESVREGED
jgi:pimeloyl-ACP methyl ester carboxylesterase